MRYITCALVGLAGVLAAGCTRPTAVENPGEFVGEWVDPAGRSVKFCGQECVGTVHVSTAGTKADTKVYRADRCLVATGTNPADVKVVEKSWRVEKKNTRVGADERVLHIFDADADETYDVVDVTDDTLTLRKDKREFKWTRAPACKVDEKAAAQPPTVPVAAPAPPVVTPPTATPPKP